MIVYSIKNKNNVAKNIFYVAKSNNSLTNQQNWQSFLYKSIGQKLFF